MISPLFARCILDVCYYVDIVNKNTILVIILHYQNDFNIKNGNFILQNIQKKH